MNDDYWKFVEEHASDDPLKLRLQLAGKQATFDVADAIMQIECRRKTRHKLSRFLASPRFRFPSLLSAEQASNQEVAALHASIVAEGETVLDMTAGLGIDAFSMSLRGARVTGVDISPAHVECLRHNAQVLGLCDFTVREGDSVSLLKNNTELFFDTIFIDPARRDERNGRTYAFRDCTPDIADAAPMVLRHCRRLMVKASPMLDITEALREIPDVSEVWAVSVAGECKEVLLIAGHLHGTLRMHAIDIGKESISDFSFPADSDNTSEISYMLSGEDPAGMWLYEPNASVMKLGCWRQLCSRFASLRKADKNTHLFFSDIHYPDFPGRILLVEDEVSQKHLKGIAANVAVRNYPMSADALRRKYRISDTADDSVFIYGAGICGKYRLLKAIRT